MSLPRASLPLLAVLALLALAAPAAARRPELSPGAAALLGKGGVFLVPADNLAVPLAAKARPVPFLAAPPRRLEILSVLPDAALLAVDDELYELRRGAFTLVAARVFAMPAVSADRKLVASIEDKKTLRLSTGTTSQTVPYRRPGRWELEHPYVTPDGAYVLAVVRDFTQPVDAYDLLRVDAKTREYEEVSISKNFAPGRERVALGGGKVAIPMYAADESTLRAGAPTTWSVFDFAARKLEPAPPSLDPGLPSPGGKRRLVPGELSSSDDKRCSADQTELHEAGRRDPARFSAEAGTVVSLLDFTPDESAVVATILSLKTCKLRAVLVPLGREEPASKWPQLLLPAVEGRITGRVLPPMPAAAPPAAAK